MQLGIQQSLRLAHRLFFQSPILQQVRHLNHQSLTMKQNRLGSSDLMVSEVCLGTMTWGVQNTEEDAHQQIEYAISRGVNFLDTAEMYPVPSSAPNWKPGRSEEFIGTYLAKHPGLREKLVIATKVAGFLPQSGTVANRYPDGKLPDGRSLNARLDAQSVRDACEASLKRLQTNYIDLYQLHWPDRYVPLFGGSTYNPKHEREGSVPIKETMLALKELLDAGKIKTYGLSNETTFGVCQFVKLAEELGMPKPATIQNSFCLLNRTFETELAEACAPSNYNIGLLPWSILGGGVLSGKYNGKVDSNMDPIDNSLSDTRFVLYKAFQGRYFTPSVMDIINKYQHIAKEEGMSIATLAQAFCKSRWYIPSSIIGATKLDQLKENIDAFEINLSPQVLEKIDKIHNEAKHPVVHA